MLVFVYACLFLGCSFLFPETEFKDFELRRWSTNCRFKFEPSAQSERLRKDLILWFKFDSVWIMKLFIFLQVEVYICISSSFSSCSNPSILAPTSGKVHFYSSLNFIAGRFTLFQTLTKNIRNFSPFAGFHQETSWFLIIMWITL